MLVTALSKSIGHSSPRNNNDDEFSLVLFIIVTVINICSYSLTK